MPAKIIKTTTTGLLFIFILIFFFRPIEIEDISWHLKTGEWIIKNKQVPHEDLFVFDENEKPTPWIFPQWLGSCIYRLFYELGKEPALKIFRSAFFLLVISVFFFYAKRKIPYSLLILFSYLLTLGLDSRGLLRPFVFNFIFIQIFLITLFSYRKEPNRRNLITLLIYAIPWSNIHIGSFVYGIFLISIFLFVEAIDCLNNKLSKIKQIDADNIIKIKHLSITLFVYFGVFFISPYGLAGGLYPFKVFLNPEFINLYTLKTMIMELRPPVYLLSFSGLWFFSLLMSVVLFLCLKSKDNRSRNRFLLTTLFLISLYLYLKSSRGSAFFSLTCVYVIVQSAAEFGLKNKWKKFRLSKVFDQFIYLVILLLMILHITAAYKSHAYYKGKMVKTLSMDYLPYNPIASIEFLRANNIGGKIFCDDINGGFIIFWDYPRLRPFVDSRQLNQEKYFKYYLIAKDPSNNWPVAEEEFGFKIAMVDQTLLSGQNLITYLNMNDDWRLIFIDGVYLIYVKKGEFNLSDEALDFEDELSSVVLGNNEIEILQDAKIENDSVKKIKRIFFPKPYYVDLIHESKVLNRLGYFNAGVKKAVKVLDVDKRLLENFDFGTLIREN